MKRLALLVTALAAVGESRGETSLFASSPMLDLRPTWAWVAGAAVFAFIVGFLLGWRMLDRRIRKKYGGLKIY